jgi:hypothetical protein
MSIHTPLIARSIEIYIKPRKICHDGRSYIGTYNDIADHK